MHHLLHHLLHGFWVGEGAHALGQLEDMWCGSVELWQVAGLVASVSVCFFCFCFVATVAASRLVRTVLCLCPLELHKVDQAALSSPHVGPTVGTPTGDTKPHSPTGHGARQAPQASSVTQITILSLRVAKVVLPGAAWSRASWHCDGIRGGRGSVESVAEPSFDTAI